MTREDMLWFVSQLEGDGYLMERPSLRDEFAMRALTGMISKDASNELYRGVKDMKLDDVMPEIARQAYAYADAMLKMRQS